MKRIALVALIGSLLGSTAPLMAGSAGLLVGYWDADGADSDEGVGFRLAGGLGSHFDLELRGFFVDELRVEGTDTDLEAFPLDLGVTYGFLPDGPANPYVGGGVSYYVLSPDEGRMQNEVGWYAVGGVEWLVGDYWSLSLDATWRQVEAAHSRPFLGERSVDLSGFGAHFAIGVHWGEGQLRYRYRRSDD